MPGADGGLKAGQETQGDLMQQGCSVVLEPSGSFLLQKLCIVWAQEQGHEEDEGICSRGLLPWRFEFFSYTCHPVLMDLMQAAHSLPQQVCHCVVFMPLS